LRWYVPGLTPVMRRLAGVLREAGFGSIRLAHETPFNIVIEARA
jgi:hypothetical protein